MGSEDTTVGSNLLVVKNWKRKPVSYSHPPYSHLPTIPCIFRCIWQTFIKHDEPCAVLGAGDREVDKALGAGSLVGSPTANTWHSA